VADVGEVLNQSNTLPSINWRVALKRLCISIDMRHISSIVEGEMLSHWMFVALALLNCMWAWSCLFDETPVNTSASSTHGAWSDIQTQSQQCGLASPR
jgi:hypothetical protein